MTLIFFWLARRVLRMARPRFRASWCRSLVLLPTSTYNPPNSSTSRKYTAARYHIWRSGSRKKYIPQGTARKHTVRVRRNSAISFRPPG